MKIKKKTLIIIGTIVLLSGILVHISALYQNKIDNKNSKPIKELLEHNEINQKSYIEVQMISPKLTTKNKKSFYFVFDKNNYYLACLEEKIADELPDEYTTKPIKIIGVTKKTSQDVFESVREKYNKYIASEKVSRSKFKKIIGTIYLDTSSVKTKKVMTLQIIAVILEFIPGLIILIGLISRKNT